MNMGNGKKNCNPYVMHQMIWSSGIQKHGPIYHPVPPLDIESPTANYAHKHRKAALERVRHLEGHPHMFRTRTKINESSSGLVHATHWTKSHATNICPTPTPVQASSQQVPTVPAWSENQNKPDVHTNTNAAQ